MRRGAGHALTAVLSMALAGCVPWTVRPIEESNTEKGAAHASRDPAAYVESIWSSKLVPAVTGSAVDARVLLDALAASPDEAHAKYGRREASGPWYFIVKGTGRITAVDRRSRAGLALVDVAPFDARPDVAIQIGPVLRGTSLRDAPGIVRFTDFVNQLQFADVANEINSRALKAIPVGLTAGRMVTFAGTASPGADGAPPVSDLVPVQLSVEERP